MKFTLIQITKQHEDSTIDGVFVVNHCAGTLETATKLAREIESKNCGGGVTIKIGVIEEPYHMGIGEYVYGKKRLDVCVDCNKELNDKNICVIDLDCKKEEIKSIHVCSECYENDYV